MANLEDVHVNLTTIGDAMWKVEYILMDYGVDTAIREIAPLDWYIRTGRASVDFLRRFIAAKPFMIARRLHKGGSDQEIIDRIRDYLYQTP